MKDVFHVLLPIGDLDDEDVAIVIAIVIAVCTQNGKIPAAVTIAIAIVTAIAVKTVEVETPVKNTTGDGIKVCVD
jgi:hypothetical protein